MLRLSFAVCVVVLAIAQPAVGAIIASGSVTDPIGDTPLLEPPDIASASIDIDSAGTITLRVTFAPGTSLTDSRVQFQLDTDQNTATGYSFAPWTGSDYFVEIYGSGFQANARVWAWPDVMPLATVAVTYSGTTAEATFNLSSFGGDDGLMNFTLASQRQLDTNSFTGVRDYAPDVGLPSAQVQAVVPEPSSAVLLTLLLAVSSMAVARRGSEKGTARKRDIQGTSRINAGGKREI
jgi:hypothetical protein